MLFGKIVLACLFIAATFTDLHGRRIPNQLIVVGLAAFALISSWQIHIMGTPLVIGSLKAGGVAFAVHLIPYCFRQMGAGDVKLSLVTGLLLGWQGWMAYLAAYCAVLFAAALVLLLAGRQKPRTLPMAPFMAASFFISQISLFFR